MISPTKPIISVLVLILLCLFASQQTICQDRTGLTGIGIQVATPPPYTYNPAFDPAESMEMKPDILISTWLTDRLALEPSLGLVAFTNETNWRLGLAIVNHFGHEKLVPFVLFRARAYFTSNSGNSMSDYVLGLGFGGEYFIGEKFSVSGECQLNYLIPDKNRSLFFITDNVFSTGVGLSSRFYLN